jgi:hypothetical protein
MYLLRSYEYSSRELASTLRPGNLQARTWGVLGPQKVRKKVRAGLDATPLDNASAQVREVWPTWTPPDLTHATFRVNVSSASRQGLSG